MALTDDKIVDIELKTAQKQRFRLNGDNNMVIELNIKDMGIVSRLNTAYPKIHEAMTKFANLDTEATDYFENALACDKELREQIDFIFDSPISGICVPSGRMYDLYDGEFAYERIINTLSKLYEAEFSNEYRRLKNRIQSAASKYINKGKSSKSKK